MNPLNMALNSGSWDPLETLEISAHLPEPAMTVDYLTFVMPMGFKSSMGRISSSLKGTATISSGSLSVDVAHGLGSTPSNVQVTPTNEIQSAFWVSDVNDGTFRINIGSAEGSDVSFYWSVSS